MILIIFSPVAVGSLMSGTLLHHVGWELLNLSVLPLTALTILWYKLSGVPAQAVQP
jgi:hypothetical protein